MFSAGLILAIMVLPFISAVSREVLMAVPRSNGKPRWRGATKWRWSPTPSCRTPGRDHRRHHSRAGRALGETMAVTMLIGNVHKISASLFAPGYTMASLIANEFAEATGDLHLSALMAVGAVLFVVTLIVNAIARWLVWRVSREARS
jgi:phosphate transport system permease protein